MTDTRVTMPIHGGIRVNDGYCLIEHDRLEVWQFDMQTKRASVDGYIFCGDGDIEVILGANESTLHIDQTAEHGWSIVKFETGWPVDWEGKFESLHCIADVSRYTLTVVLWVSSPEDDHGDSFVSFEEETP